MKNAYYHFVEASLTFFTDEEKMYIYYEYMLEVHLAVVVELKFPASMNHVYTF